MDEAFFEERSYVLDRLGIGKQIRQASGGFRMLGQRQLQERAEVP